jgi:hypothetical protein
MTRLSKFMVSLVVQALLVALAMCLLDSGMAAINLAALCTAWNLILIADWGLCRFRVLRHRALMLSLPAWVLSGLPAVFLGIALSVRWEL